MLIRVTLMRLLAIFPMFVSTDVNCSKTATDSLLTDVTRENRRQVSGELLFPSFYSRLSASRISSDLAHIISDFVNS